MKCPDCSSDLNLKETVRLARSGRVQATVCFYCGNLAALSEDDNGAMHVDACHACGSPAADPLPGGGRACDLCSEEDGASRPFVETVEQTTARVMREASRLFPSLNIPSTSKYFDKVLAGLAASAGAARDAYRTRIAPDLGFRALSVPGGTIFLGSELLCGLEDEAMLAFALAREIAHLQSARVLRRFRGLQPRRALSTGFDWGISLLTGAPTALARRSADTVREVALLGYGPVHEEDADAFGIGLLVRAGYDPAAAVRYLALLERCDLSSRRALAPFLDVRPVSSRRRLVVEALVAAHCDSTSIVRLEREGYRRAVARLMRHGLVAAKGSRGAESRTHDQG